MHNIFSIMDRARVTILLPFYNSEKNINFTIKSILNQTHKNWILFLYNDGSTDNSLEIINNYLQDERILLFNSETNKGISFALNYLLQFVNTEFIARIDSDDIMFEERLEIQLKYFELYPETSLLSTNAVIIDSNNKILGSRAAWTKNMRCTEVSSLKKRFINRNNIIHPSIMAKFKIFENHKFDEDLRRSSDHDLWFRLSKHYHFRYINEPLIFYRISSLNYNLYLKSLKSDLKIASKYRSPSFFDFLYLFSFLFISFKIVFYYCLNKVGIFDFFIKSRIAFLTRSNRDLFYNELRKSL